MFIRTQKLGSVSSAPRVLGLLAAVWMGLALQPCAVADEVEQDCPHCPTEVVVELAPADDHCGSKAKDTQTVSVSCVSVQSDCTDTEEGIFNARVESENLDDDSPDLPLCMASTHLSQRTCERTASLTGPPDSTGGSVPLFVLKCAYLI